MCLQTEPFGHSSERAFWRLVSRAATRRFVRGDATDLRACQIPLGCAYILDESWLSNVARCRAMARGTRASCLRDGSVLQTACPDARADTLCIRTRCTKSFPRGPDRLAGFPLRPLRTLEVATGWHRTWRCGRAGQSRKPTQPGRLLNQDRFISVRCSALQKFPPPLHKWLVGCETPAPCAPLVRCTDVFLHPRSQRKVSSSQPHKLSTPPKGRSVCLTASESSHS